MDGDCSQLVLRQALDLCMIHCMIFIHSIFQRDVHLSNSFCMLTRVYSLSPNFVWLKIATCNRQTAIVRSHIVICQPQCSTYLRWFVIVPISRLLDGQCLLE